MPTAHSDIIADASVLINLIHIQRLPLLDSLPFSWYVPDAVVAEVTFPDQAAELAAALDSGLITLDSCTEPSELAIYAELRQRLGRGESACLAIAEARGWIVACDEGRAFANEASRRVGESQILNTPGILLLGIRAGVLSVDEADQAKALLETRRYRMTFGSFGELL